MTNEPIVRVERLSHRYSASWAIRDINFEIHQTGVLGLLGSNGAGKSTTMNIMCGVLNQTEGFVYIDGIDMRRNPEAAKKKIGFLPQAAPLHLDLTVDEYLTHCAYMRQVEEKNVKPFVEEAKARCGVAHFSRRLIKNLSGGYRQRVGIAQAIIHKPRLVVLDEPTNGLDPNQILEVRALIKEIAEERSVIFSSHILSEVQATCREVKMIEQGRMVFADSIDAFNNYIIPNSLIMTLDNPPAIEVLQGIEGIIQVRTLTENQFRLHFEAVPKITNRIVELSVAGGWQLSSINLEKSSLDEVFAQLSGKASTNKP
ncbi:MAG TPA: ATP-binding cassette domain-containing protein [Pseudobacter sp.]|nr:ATP-binding cassette domain-containing protein [Pseudobacter sp.]